MINTRIKAIYAGVLAATMSGAALAGTVTSDGADIVISTKGGGFQAATTDGQFKFKVDGRLQLDVDSGDGVFNDGDSGSEMLDTEIRRARIGFSGTTYKDWHYNLTVNLAGSGAAAGDLLDHAYIRYTGLDFANLTFGRFKPPMGLEAMTSSKWITTIERSEIYNSTAAEGISKRIGAMINGNVADQFTWAYSVFDSGTDEPDNNSAAGSSSTERSNLEHTARLTWSPIHTNTQAVHLGIAHAKRDFGGAAMTNIVDTEAGIHLAKTDFVVDAAAANDDETTIFEAAWMSGPFSIQGEYLNREVDVQNAAGTIKNDFEADGFYVQGAWTLTGESRTYKWKDGKFDKIKPKGDMGAWELVAKYESIDYDLDLAGANAAFSDIDMDVMTLGLNWYANQNVKLMLNYVDAEIDGMAALTSNIGASTAVDGYTQVTDIVGNEEDGKAITARLQYVF